MKLKQRVIAIIITFVLLGCLYSLLRKSERSQVKDPKDVRIFPALPKEVHNVHKSILNTTRKQNALFIENELERLRLDFLTVTTENVDAAFQTAENWVDKRQIYPHDHHELSAILKRMISSKIVFADVLPKGTQIKLLLALEGGQKVVFKQKRYERDFVIEGKPYEGYDRHNAEIAAFHLDRIMDFRRAPLVVGRKINLNAEIKPVATDRLLKTFRNQDGNVCYFGHCLYCKEENMACANGEVIEGSVTLWLPKKWSNFVKQRHPYQRTYIDGRSAKWEVDETYCDQIVKKQPPYDKGPRLLDIMDGAVFDFLIGNADRHHYETFRDKGPDAMMVMLDNAKSFGNPNVHEKSILAPITQCCILRNSTMIKLKQLGEGILTQLLEAAMENDPLYPILHPSHLNAIDIRLPIILDAINDCCKSRGKDKVIINKWDGL